jgi:IclR family acetate operon transcriptional repressor
MHSAQQNTEARAYQIELVDKLVRLLETLRDEPRGLSLQELTARTGFVKSSIHRIVNSLKHHGYIEQPEPGAPYRLGTQFLSLARAMNHGIQLLPYARPYLQELVDAFNESAYLAVLRGGKGIFIEVIETRRDLRLVGPLGAEVHYHATAAGKAIAASLPATARAALLSRLDLTRLTARTLTTRGRVEREWAEVARRGFATNDEETIVGAIFLAAPVLDARPAVCGAVSVGVPKARYAAALGRKVAARLKDACHRLSRALKEAGYVHEDRLDGALRDQRSASAAALALVP